MRRGADTPRVLKLAIVSALFTVLATGCGWNSKSVEIVEVSVSQDGLTLELTIARCGDDIRAEIQEDGESVAVWASARNATGVGCTDAVTIQLDAPLDERAFIDGYDFSEIDVQESES